MSDTDLSPDDCQCYECIGPRYKYQDGHPVLWNNAKRHTLGEPCSECGRPKGHYRDLGSKGYYVCWWCDGPGFVDDTGHRPPEIEINVELPPSNA